MIAAQGKIVSSQSKFGGTGTGDLDDCCIGAYVFMPSDVDPTTDRRYASIKATILALPNSEVKMDWANNNTGLPYFTQTIDLAPYGNTGITSFKVPKVRMRTLIVPCPLQTAVSLTTWFCLCLSFCPCRSAFWCRCDPRTHDATATVMRRTATPRRSRSGSTGRPPASS